MMPFKAELKNNKTMKKDSGEVWGERGGFENCLHKGKMKVNDVLNSFSIRTRPPLRLFLFFLLLK